MGYANTGKGKAREAKQAATVAALAVSVGTSDGTVADVGAAFSQATLNSNFRDVADKINEVVAALKAAGLMA
ncbi:hypothetical protein [Streptomyces abikoensis]|uniref:Uncharacterized protein n=1 Tax=Streptomyces abikoensis TaxID=97398 RepID=A0ABW7T9V9_9ACTN